MGAFLALAHDYRIMRNDRGWFCLPEIFFAEANSNDFDATSKVGWFHTYSPLCLEM